MSNMEKLLLIWKDPDSRTRYTIGELIKNDNEYLFHYVNPELNSALDKKFTTYPGFPNYEEEYKSENLFPNISGRLPNKKREDYIEILNYYDLENNAGDFEILKQTKGRLITDNFEFVPEFDKNKIEFEVAGTRYSKDLMKNKDKIKNDSVLRLEIVNYKDEPAVKILTNVDNNFIELGYVPRYYAKEVANLLKDNVNYSAMIKKIRFDSQNPDENITASVKLLFD